RRAQPTTRRPSHSVAQLPLRRTRPPTPPGRQRPPTSTLFPYTTLFRSGRLVYSSRQEFPIRGQVGQGVTWNAQPAEQPAAAPTPDRKSTRLNSSHVAISYAVFCLKKKTTRFPAFVRGTGRDGASFTGRR